MHAAGQWKIHAAWIRPCMDGHEYKRRGVFAGEPQAKSRHPAVLSLEREGAFRSMQRQIHAAAETSVD
jgi:hypothetical protein